MTELTPTMPKPTTNYGQLAANMEREAELLIVTKGRTSDSSDVRLLRDGAKAIRELAAAPAGAQGSVARWFEVTNPRVNGGLPMVIDGPLTEESKSVGWTERPLYTATPAASEDAMRLNEIAAQSWKLEPFDMPTGAGDADIGWRVIEYIGPGQAERVVAEVYRDDPRAAIDAARDGEGVG